MQELIDWVFYIFERLGILVGIVLIVGAEVSLYLYHRFFDRS
jgi:hypothetical protein